MCVKVEPVTLTATRLVTSPSSTSVTSSKIIAAISDCTQSYDSRTTSRGWSCTIVGDRSTLQSYEWTCDQSSDLNTGRATRRVFAHNR